MLTSLHSGTEGSFEQWAEQVGDSSYTWEQVLPYYMKSIQYTAPNQSLYVNATNNQTSSAFSPTGGPVQVSFSNFVDPFGTWAQKAFESIGLDLIDGFDSGSLIGSAYATLTIDPRDARRSSSEQSFLQTAIQRSLAPIVYHNSLVQKIN